MNPIETFFEAWGQSDEATRKQQISASVTPNVTYADPRAPEPITGIDALSTYVGMFSANAPGWTASVVKQDTIAGLHRVTVAFGGAGPDGAPMRQLGQYFVELEGERACRLVGFVGTGEPG